MKQFLRRHLYLKILLNIILILAEAAVGMWLIYFEQGIILGCVLIGIALLHIGLFAVLLNRMNKRIALFFNAIQDGEAMLSFPEDQGSKQERMLNQAFNRVNELLAKTKKDSRKQELLYHSILSEMPEGVIAWNEEGHIIVINSAAFEFLGCEYVVYMHQLERLYPELRPIIRSESDTHSSLFRIKSKNKYRQLTIAKKTINLAEQTIYLLTVKDIGQELSDKETESWNKLTHVLTHEIMNTIAPIVSLSETLTGYFVQPESITDATMDKTKKGLGIIESHSKRLMSFTESYRLLSHLPVPKKEQFNISLFIEEFKTLFQQDIANNEIEFKVNSSPATIYFVGDKDLLSQIFINLIKNAIQSLSSRKTGRKVEIRLTKLEKLIIEVSNNGEAIPQNMQEEIFVPFFTTKPQGTGIGLSVSKQIVRLHEGEISLRSSEELGTIFRIELPIYNLQ